MKIKFKEAAVEDISVIVQLAEIIWRKYYTSIVSTEQIEYMLKKMYSTESLLQQINQGHKFTLVYDNELPLGYISMSTNDEKNYFLHKFYVQVDEHRKGIGSKLFKHILNQLNTFVSIELTVNRSNYKAINFYFKHGFVIKEVADFDIGNGYFMNDFVMIKIS